MTIDECLSMAFGVASKRANDESAAAIVVGIVDDGVHDETAIGVGGMSDDVGVRGGTSVVGGRLEARGEAMVGMDG